MGPPFPASWDHLLCRNARAAPGRLGPLVLGLAALESDSGPIQDRIDLILLVWPHLGGLLQRLDGRFELVLFEKRLAAPSPGFGWDFPLSPQLVDLLSDVCDQPRLLCIPNQSPSGSRRLAFA
ncbi:hypothetical protein TOPH_02153 [Tolypocladium ophioglossoides CBS 100239]|uniref:Uncharacterized protein n=1 Tax=Tolypocladium ophioglossoides (strain CBS 100239) TaxID=1163406 RepID=A0A0L0NH56_TOLOC|nr:hypothetical protein TOPH_02153 [Tolypocladium ophioglossoides CBS 100239]